MPVAEPAKGWGLERSMLGGRCLPVSRVDFGA